MGKEKKTKKRYASPLTVCLTAVCLLLAVFVLNGYISLNELTLQASKRKKELAELDGQNAVLAVSIERKNSLASIEEIATEKLGMIKLEPYNIRTVNLADGDKAEFAQSGDTGSFLDGIVSNFNILFEYLN